MIDTLLVLNAGSSSIKFQVFADDYQCSVIFKGMVEGIGATPHFQVKDKENQVLLDTRWKAETSGRGHHDAFARIINWLDKNLDGYRVIGVGHRVAHGGAAFSTPVLVTNSVTDQLQALIGLAPLHQPHNLAGIEAVREIQPELPQVACFDTMFHRAHPAVADRFGIPDALYQEGIRRYGFHGQSYAYIAMQLKTVAPEIANGRVVIAHLGSGASLCALKNGRSMDTTMSFSALDGLLMGTRCGSLDPGVMLYLLGEKGMSVKELEILLYRQSGLLGISGISNDLRDLLSSEEPQAIAAIDYFVYRIQKELGSLAAVLGGLDALVFTAGIGENSAAIRERVCQQACWLGIALNPEANQDGETLISRKGSLPSVWIIPTDEERMIALDTFSILAEFYHH